MDSPSAADDLTAGFSIAVVGWGAHEQAMATVRQQVFIDEQHVPEALEWDGLDAAAIHVLAKDIQDDPIGCGRLLRTGKIGRMAVLPEWRGKGIGWALLQALLVAARQQGMVEIALSAQAHAIPFYQKAGFVVCSDLYDDAGIPHRDMVLTLTD
jgi:predicted GNAT family N-acyltransferase